MSLPDSCADLLLSDLDSDSEGGGSVSRSAEDQWEQGSAHSCVDRPLEHAAPDCCRTLSGSGSVRCASAGSLLQVPADNSRSGTCRRDNSTRGDGAAHRQSVSECVPSSSLARLSAAVPDVAMAPNANTHLLTARDYFRLTPYSNEYSGGVLQLDLGDGATHTPRPGSRAQRAGARPHREHHAQAMSCLRSRADDDELRAAIELSVIRAYSSFGPRAAAAAPSSSHAPLGAAPLGAAPAGAAPLGSAPLGSAWRGTATLPQSRSPNDMQLAAQHMPTGSRPPAGSPAPTRGADLHTPPPHLALSRVGSGERTAASSSRSPSSSPAASPRRPHDYLYRRHQHHDYRLEAQYGSSSGSASRGHSPNTYA